MKKHLWLLPVALLLLVAAAFPVRFLSLQTDMDGGNHAITNVSYFVGKLGLTNLTGAVSGAYIYSPDGVTWVATVANTPTNITLEQVTNTSAYVSEVRTNILWSDVTAALALKAPRVSPRLNYPIVTNGATFEGTVEIDDVLQFPNFTLSESAENIFQIITAGYEGVPLSIFGNLIYADLRYATNLPRTGVTGLESALDYLTNHIGSGLGYTPQPAGSNLTNWNELGTNVLMDLYPKSNPSNYVSWTASSNLSFSISQVATNGQWLAVSNVDYDLQTQINSLTGTPTNGITAEIATNISKAMAKQVTNVITHGNVQYDQGATNYLLFWDTSSFQFAECPDLYLDDSGTLYGTAFAGNGALLTSLNADNIASGTVPLARLSGIRSNEIASATDAVYRQDNGKEVTVSTGLSISTNGNLVTLSANTSDYWADSSTVVVQQIQGLDPLETNLWTGSISIGYTSLVEVQLFGASTNGVDRAAIQYGYIVTRDSGGTVSIDGGWSYTAGSYSSLLGDLISTGGGGLAYKVTLGQGDSRFRINVKTRTTTLEHP